MNSPIIQLLVLAGVAVFLILRLRGVLGTREGFEKPPASATKGKARPDFEVIEGGPDPDIIDHVPEGSPAADALARMKRIEPSFGVGEFLGGARGAYEMILMAFEKGDLSEIKPFLGPDVYETFSEVVESREAQGLKIESDFIGIREMVLQDAALNDETGLAELTIRYVGELTSVVRDSSGEIIEGNANQTKKQKDIWTYARTMGSDNPNWQLVVTGE
ncbi:Tim44/TimA family putative adaptor protein [Puniceibacterium sediminis]|uniref:Predicted lipid-binding transport protein, Tim44 family n=1 Tax=Puniceibacterium sediminis TaxID=1608407 RepID=A0A238VRQ3_9RHOB|nr:Tim44/TimA family putative adaptor protein [Puniceibacterium sediminis]SNR36985.1 Predicted lipid-binding transport protein, Tim44 family [Puniceibacterium sediminis]